jgi:hypothetical protein
VLEAGAEVVAQEQPARAGAMWRHGRVGVPGAGASNAAEATATAAICASSTSPTAIAQPQIGGADDPGGDASPP